MNLKLPKKVLSLLLTILAGAIIAADEQPVPKTTKSKSIKKVMDKSTEAKKTPSISIRLNFKNAPVEAVIDHLSEAAGLIIIKDGAISGTIDVQSQHPLNLEESISLLNNVLSEKGYAAILTDKTLRVIPKGRAATQDLPVIQGQDPDAMKGGEEMATQIIPIRYADATKLIENLQPLLPENAIINANTSSNALVLTSSLTTIRRMARIVKALDTSISNISEIRVFPLEHAEAESLAEVVNKVFEQPSSRQNQANSRNPMSFFARMRGRRGGPPGGEQTDASASEAKIAAAVTAIGEERSNCLVVSAPGELIDPIEQLVEKMDVSTEDKTSVQIFPLKYADAEEMADMVAEIFSADNDDENIPGTRQMGGFMGMMRGMRGGPPTSGRSGTERSLGEAEVSVVADTRTNSLVVNASPTTMTAIKAVLQTLDSTPKNVTQVYIYRIENADLENIKEILESLFEDIEDSGNTTAISAGGGRAAGGATGGTTNNNRR